MSMYPKNMLFTSESVTEGHPDKLCDQVSDLVLDECLRQDPQSRVACDVYVTLGTMIIGGEITTTAMFNVDALVRTLGKTIGYTSPLYGYDINAGAILRPSTLSRSISPKVFHGNWEKSAPAIRG